MESAAKSGEDKTWEGQQTNAIFRKVVRESVKAGTAPYLDVHVLFVAPIGTGNRGHGMSLLEARRKDDSRHRQLGWDEMAIGYQDPSTGYFRRYKIKYVAASDTALVTL